MKITSAIILILSLCLTACNSQTDKAKTASSPAVKEVVIPEGPLAKKLYANYHADPQTQAQKDENRLIEYAVSSNIQVERTASGFYYNIKKKDDLPLYLNSGYVSAHYRGRTLDGNEFDSSYKNGAPITFNHGQMIPGWNEALLMMNPGSKATLLIPSHLAYGTRGFPGYIEPNEPLVFEIETQIE